MKTGARTSFALAALFLAAAVAPGEPPRAWGGPAGRAPAARAGSALPAFALFGWVSPPIESTTVARYAEMAGAGFRVALPAWEDPGLVPTNRARLAAAAGTGLRVLVVEADLDRVSLAQPATLALADSIVARRRGDDAFLGWYLGDEPDTARFARLGEWFTILRARDPAHPCWNNLLGRGAFATRAEFEAYVRAYVAAVHPVVLCDDQYDFLAGRDKLQFTENIASLAAVARENALPFWGIVQLTQHLDYREVDDGLLRWQVAQWLAWGAHGIGIFTYWTPAPDSAMNWRPGMIAWDSGARTPHYERVRALNARVGPLGDTLASAQWLATEHAGSVPPGGVAFAPGELLAGVAGRATLGVFAGANATPLVLVANADSVAPRTVTLALAQGRRAWRLRDDGFAWNAVAADAAGRVALPLAAGDFALLRLSGAVDSLVAGAAPRLAVAPNPARGAVHFDASHLSPPARLDLYDAAGRRVWARTFTAAGGGAEWRGEDEGGGAARAGLYFARLADVRGAVVRRLAWLGTR